MKSQQLKKIIYFDGICNLCNWSVRFILKYDKNVVFLFASLQSEFTKKHLVHFNDPERKNESIVYQDHQVFYTKSDAVLKILNDLGGVWKLFYVFKIIPQNLRDWLYDLIARNRYRLFGKKDNCMIPSPEVKNRFLGWLTLSVKSSNLKSPSGRYGSHNLYNEDFILPIHSYLSIPENPL